MTPSQRLAYEIKRGRKTWHLSQRELAERAGTTQRVISLLEAGRYNPSIAMVQAIAGALNMYVEVGFNPRRRG